MLRPVEVQEVARPGFSGRGIRGDTVSAKPAKSFLTVSTILRDVCVLWWVESPRRYDPCMRSTSRLVLIALFSAFGIARAQSAAPDCLGARPVVVRLGRIGALPSAVTVKQLRQLCPSARDTVASGDETLDTAIVVSAPDIRIIGHIALIDDGGDRLAYRLTDTTRVRSWEVSGPGGVLADGTPTDASWAYLEGAYGRLTITPVNGWLYVRAARWPGLFFKIPDPLYNDTSRVRPSADLRLKSRVHVASIMVAAVPSDVAREQRRSRIPVDTLHVSDRFFSDSTTTGVIILMKFNTAAQRAGMLRLDAVVDTAARRPWLLSDLLVSMDLNGNGYVATVRLAGPRAVIDRYVARIEAIANDRSVIYDFGVRRAVVRCSCD